ncbi:MAG: WG repeat-containing protein [Fluviicola sp.]|nr:WG repeat-containing protein [Fluviicola sp.]
MKIVQLLVVTLFFGLAVQAQQYNLIEQNGRYGYTFQGKVVIPATFQYATHFSEERALVKQNNLWGYIDSTGKWIVPPTFQTAGLFKEGVATVFVNGKMGLLRTDGSYKAKPIFDTLIEQYNGVEVIAGGKKGWISNDWEGQIPAEYVLFSSAHDYVSAKKANAGYDLYWRGKLLKTDLEYAVAYGDVHVDAKQVTVWVDGKKGVLDQAGNWIVEPVYSNITYHFMGSFFDDYLTATPAFYVLDSTEYQYFDDQHELWEQLGPQKYFLAKTSGELISKSPIEYIQQMGYNTGTNDHIRLQMNGKVAYLESDYSITETPYVNIETYFNWQLLNDGEKIHIVDYRNKEVGVFDAVTVPETGIPEYDEYGEPTGEYVEVEYKPYVEVMKLQDGVETWAVYELEEQKIITGWTAQHHSITYFPREGTNRLYVDYRYETETGSCDYYIAGSEGIMDDYSHTWITPTLNNWIIVQNDLQKDFVLLHLNREKGPVEILHAPYMELSTNRYEPTFVELEVEGYFDPIPVYSFKENFIFYKGTNGKSGLVTIKNKVFPAIFDTIVQNESLPNIVDVQVNGKWGSIDFQNGNYVPPTYDQPLTFIQDYEADLTYATFDTHYLTSDGQLFYSLNPELIPFKSKGKHGRLAFNDIAADDSKVVTIPAVYKSIKTTDIYNRFIAQGKNGLYGIINQLNDTIVPFNYTNFGEPKFISALETTVFPASIGKKTGYVNPITGAVLPSIYDRITILMDSYGFESGIQVISNGKTGFYSLVLEPILPVEFDGLYIMGSFSSALEIRAQRKGKWTVAWEPYFYMINEYKLSTLTAYDVVVDNFGYVKTPEGYDQYDLTMNKRTKSGVKEIELPVFDGSTQLVLENGKIGAKTNDKTIVLPYSLTSVVKLNGDTMISVKDAEFGYYVLSLNKWFKLNEWQP